MTAAGPATTRPQRQQSADGQVLGLLLLLGGVAWLLDRSGIVDVSWVTVVSVLLVVLGVGMVMTARRRGGPWLFLLGLGMTVALAAASSVDLGLIGEGIDDRRIAASTLAGAEQQAATQGELFAGQLTVDLRRVAPEELSADSVLRYQLGFGHLVLRLPPEEAAPVEIHTSVRGGKVEIFDEPLRTGSNFDVDYADKAEGTKLKIELTMGFGAVQVVRDSG